MRSLWRDFRRDVSVPAVVAGFVAVLVGFTSSVVIVFQAAAALGATPEQAASWMWALGLGMGLTSIALSIRHRMPVLTAWSTPGAALIATGGAGLSMAEGTGAFIVAAALVALAGASGLFERLMNRIPMALAAALLAGVLARFAFDAFRALGTDTLLVATMAGAYLAGRRFRPRWAVPGVLLAGIGVAAAQGTLDFGRVPWPSGWATPVFTMPVFTFAGVVGLALPLFVVTMASQNLPGVAAQRAAGYDVPVSPAIATTGVATLLLAPFGGFMLNLAAITAAICMGPEASIDPRRRWTAAVAAGAFYVLLGLAGGAVVGLIAAFPKALVLSVAGLALLSTIGSALGNALGNAMQDDTTREAALVTFLVTASGVVLWGVASAFWGVVAGAVVLGVGRRRG
jgi:benzoate membrane transport protein